MQTSIHSAVQTLLEHQIHSLPISGADVERIIRKQGFEIIPLNVPFSQSDIESLTELGILEIAKKYKAFTYVNDEQKHRYVFYKTTLSAEKKSILLSHELGHIRLAHFAGSGICCSSDFKNTSPQEQEADEFAIELLAPTCILKGIRQITPEKISHLTLLETSKAEHVFFKVKSHSSNTRDEKKLCDLFKAYEDNSLYNVFTRKQKYIALLIGAIIICIIGVCVGRYSNNHQKVPASLPSSQIMTTSPSPIPTPIVGSDISARQVVVTKAGDKFHRADCQYVRNKTDTLSITIEEAINSGHTPCKVCRPTA